MRQEASGVQCDGGATRIANEGQGAISSQAHRRRSDIRVAVRGGKKRRAKESRQPDRRIISRIRSKIWPVRGTAGDRTSRARKGLRRRTGARQKERGEGRGEEEPRHVWNELLLLSSSLTRAKGCARASMSFSLFFRSFHIASRVTTGRRESVRAKNRAKLARLLSTSSCYPFDFNFTKVPPCTFVGASVLTTSFAERTDKLYLVPF